MSKNIFVYVETSDGSPVSAALEILGKARALADENSGSVTAALIGTDVSEAAKTVSQRLQKKPPYDRMETNNHSAFL